MSRKKVYKILRDEQKERGGSEGKGTGVLEHKDKDEDCIFSHLINISFTSRIYCFAGARCKHLIHLYTSVLSAVFSKMIRGFFHAVHQNLTNKQIHCPVRNSIASVSTAIPMWIKKKKELTRFLGLTRERILLIDSPSDRPSKSMYNNEHLKAKQIIRLWFFSKKYSLRSLKFEVKIPGSGKYSLTSGWISSL